MDLDKNLVRKVTSFRPTDFGTGPVPTRDKPKFHLAVLHFWWFLGLSQKSENRVRKVTSFRPTIFGRPVLSRILGCGNPGVCSECSRPSSDQVRALEPGIRAKTGFWKSYIFSPNNLRTSRIVPYCPVFWVPRPKLGPNWSGTGPNWSGTCPNWSSPSSNLEPSGLLSAVHTHNLAVYSKSGNFGHAHSLNTGAAKNGLRPKKPLNRGPEWEK